MTTEKMYVLDASNCPARMGQSWEDDEVLKLLTSIQKKKPIETIAMEHERTVGGIRSRIRVLAAEYHFNDQRSMEEIQKYTGLAKEEIEDIIKRREIKNANSKQKKQPTSAIPKKKVDEHIPNIKEMFSMLKDIQEKLTVLMEEISQNKSFPYAFTT
jgi:predicted DNA-binding protein YlxM (UPF0122 family)